MKKRILLAVISISCLAFFITTVSCGMGQMQNKVKEPKEIKEPQSAPQQDAYEYEKVEIKKSDPSCTTANTENCTNFSLTYDRFKSGTHKDEINAKILDFILNNIYSTEEKKKISTIDDLINLFFSDYLEIKKQEEKEKSDYPIQPWTLEIVGEVKHISKNLISYEVSYSIFTGGAHPLSGTYYFNFNSSTGKVVSLQELFKKNFDSELDKLIEKHFRAIYELKPNQPLTEFLFENHINHNDNFLFLPDGIEFCYNQYEIAPYAVGIIRVKIPKSELSNLLNDEFK